MKVEEPIEFKITTTTTVEPALWRDKCLMLTGALIALGGIQAVIAIGEIIEAAEEEAADPVEEQGAFNFDLGTDVPEKEQKT